MKNLSAGKITLISILVVLVLLVAVSVGSYNGLVNLNEGVKTQSSNIETQLQRRSDLIPNLLNTVKGYMSYESDVIKNITDARASLAGASSMREKATADNQLTSALNNLLVVVENYPNLKASEEFVSLMDELSGTENRITVARKDYNDAVNTYNSKIKTFPTVIIAKMFGFNAYDYFEASEGSKVVPSVSFE